MSVCVSVCVCVCVCVCVRVQMYESSQYRQNSILSVDQHAVNEMFLQKSPTKTHQDGEMSKEKEQREIQFLSGIMKVRAELVGPRCGICEGLWGCVGVIVRFFTPLNVPRSYLMMFVWV